MRRHMRVMFSTTTGVLMFTAMRKRLRAASRQGCSLSWESCRQDPALDSTQNGFRGEIALYWLAWHSSRTHRSAGAAPSSCPPWRWSLSAAASRTGGCWPATQSAPAPGAAPLPSVLIFNTLTFKHMDQS